MSVEQDNNDISAEYDNDISIEDDSNISYHSNILIYDKNENRIERFEPNGLKQNLYDNELVENTLFEKFKLLNIQYTKCSYFLPKLGPQVCDYKLLDKNTGFCTT
jgi:hypothetical protein